MDCAVDEVNKKAKAVLLELEEETIGQRNEASDMNCVGCLKIASEMLEESLDSLGDADEASMTKGTKK